MSRSRHTPGKREPKSKKDFLGCGVSPFCGMTCCGLHGSAARKKIRTHRRQQTLREIEQGLAEYEEG